MSLVLLFVVLMNLSLLVSEKLLLIAGATLITIFQKKPCLIFKGLCTRGMTLILHRVLLEVWQF